ncbi:MAG: hypothetical protein WBB00_03825 [Mycobacterium sp.]
MLDPLSPEESPPLTQALRRSVVPAASAIDARSGTLTVRVLGEVVVIVILLGSALNMDSSWLGAGSVLVSCEEVRSVTYADRHGRDAGTRVSIAASRTG